jgi:NADPH:quinone reductase-like Zn-dependent oxidoreductase
VGSITTQIAAAAGIRVISVTSARNLDFSKDCGAAEAFDYKDPSFVDQVVDAVTKSGLDFVGVIDAVSTPETYANDLLILNKLGGGHLACVHPPPENVPENVKAGMIFAVNDVATPVWKEYVTPALETGKLKCTPPALIVGKGLEHVQEALKKCEGGVSATKVVVEL